MLINIKFPKRLVFFCNFFLNRQNLSITQRSFTSFKRFTSPPLEAKSVWCKVMIPRGKSSTKKTTYERNLRENEDDESDEEEDDEEFQFKGDEVKTYETQAARVDKILKVCYKVSRKDIQDLFYQTKIRVNGKILQKKSAHVQVGDEIDIIKGFVNDNSKLINVNRIEILNIKENPDNLRYNIKVKKSKSLIVENYSESNEWRGG